VGSVDRLRHLTDELDGFGYGQAAAVSELRGERSAQDELHGEEGADARLRARVVDGDDVRVSKTRDGRRLALMKPQTFMNESGRAVAAAIRFFKIPAGSLLVVHDEVDLEPGRLQARAGGGLAGHNGLRSIARHFKTQEFLRLRVGVGRPERGDRRPVADYVLSPFDEDFDVEALVGRAADAVETIARDGLEAAQRLYNDREPES